MVLSALDRFGLAWLGSDRKFSALQRQNTEFRNKYSQKRNIGVSVPISTFMSLWVIYILPPSVCLFCWRKYVDRSWEHINPSQTHECGHWGWGRAIPRKGIHKWDFRCSVELKAAHGCLDWFSDVAVLLHARLGLLVIWVGHSKIPHQTVNKE